MLQSAPPIEHYIQLIAHRKWLILCIFVAVAGVTAGIVQALPNMYTSSTTIMVNPQKVPETYVRSTVTGTVRDRLNTLQTQILSGSRLQTIIDSLHLYQLEKKTMNREEVLIMMRKDITTAVVNEFGPSQELQAFRISYTGRQPRLVAQVTNMLADQFIEENLKARENQSDVTTSFLKSQLAAARKDLEAQEATLKEYRMKHIGEMPESQNTDLQILGQLQSQAHLEGEALNRAQQQRLLDQSMMGQNAPVIDIDSGDDIGGAPSPSPKTAAAGPAPAVKKSELQVDRENLAEMLKRYSASWPGVAQLKKKVADEEAKEALSSSSTATATPMPKVPVPPPPPAAVAASGATPPAVPKRFNPVLQAQIDALDTEIAKHQQEIQRVSGLIASYQARLEAIPVREQETTALVRNYEMTKGHYAQLESQSLSAETADQLEESEKGEQFMKLDVALTPEKPSSPNRPLLDAVGALGGMLLGLLVALSGDIFGMTIIAPQDITSSSNLTILEIIPVIMTRTDLVVRKRRLLLATVSMVVMTITASTILFLHFRNRI